MNKELNNKEYGQDLLVLPLFEIFTLLRIQSEKEETGVGLSWKFKDCKFEVICKEVEIMSNLEDFLEPLKELDEKSICFFKIKGEENGHLVPYAVSCAKTPLGDIVLLTFEKADDVFDGDSKILEALLRVLSEQV